MSQLPFKHSFKTTDHVLENVHLDLCGPFQTPSLAGAKYFLIIVNQLSGFITTKFLKNKNNFFNHFCNFKLSAENLQETKIKKITTDGGGEFVNKSFKNLCIDFGIEHIISLPYTPQHNPFSERNNCSVVEKARCILLQSKLPLRFWAEAVSTATFLCNLIPKHENSVTPHEIWFKSKPPLHKLRPFGCQTWVKIPKNFVTNEFASKTWDGILLGYENDVSSYWILRTHDQKIIISKHVIFDEVRFPLLPSHFQNNIKIFNAFPGLIQTSQDKSLNDQPKDNFHNIELISSDNEDEDSFVDELEQKPQRIRVIGPRHPTLISSDINSENMLPFHRRQPRMNTTKQICSIPNSFEEAMKSSNKEEWRLEIKKILNINKLNVWTLREKTYNDHPITSTWIFKEKRDDSGKTIEYMACLCTHGFHQIAGIDYQNTFAPTGRLSLLRTLISFASVSKYEFHQMDIRSAFLNAPLQEEICLEIPQGVEGNTKTQVLHLNKALYSLKQASLAWNKHLSSWLTSTGFRCSLADPCVFWRTGKAHLLLGLRVSHLHDGFALDQEHYINKLAEKYEINKLTPSNTPLKPHLQLSNHLSQFLEKPGLEHWNACLQVFRYLFNSKDICLTFKNHGFNHIKTYADADWGNNPIDRRSISGFTVSINSHLIALQSKKQQTVSHSTTEAEYKSLSNAAKETSWLLNLINEIQITSYPLEPLLLNDKKGAIDLALCEANHSRFKTKHMDIKFHFIRELLRNGRMLLKHVSTTSMNANFLTKSIGATGRCRASDRRSNASATLHHPRNPKTGDTMSGAKFRSPLARQKRSVGLKKASMLQGLLY
ncbi:hypothetical protein O181_012924 [Austropuccinia psidii MF-1]|uniref:Integrase catalytic domain-containing protein n=1 Tax=Austropuccinia psidii MF-1 TaxID=1389203 RepID=A0A9Q3BX76_9BASI|nr:hypothetical protein [Austropuccinia psidii MF-1]